MLNSASERRSAAASLRQGRGSKKIRVYDRRLETEAKTSKLLETAGLDFNDFLRVLHKAMPATLVWGQTIRWRSESCEIFSQWLPEPDIWFGLQPGHQPAPSDSAWALCPTDSYQWIQDLFGGKKLSPVYTLANRETWQLYFSCQTVSPVESNVK